MNDKTSKIEWKKRNDGARLVKRGAIIQIMVPGILNLVRRNDSINLNMLAHNWKYFALLLGIYYGEIACTNNVSIID